jgi:hypothetical protein
VATDGDLLRNGPIDGETEDTSVMLHQRDGVVSYPTR